ncbi:DNA polymerase III subunit gamma/tau [Desulfothermobacter acidiphilus]|uniref:DNA polymerase III subunit gamma/tau n=1 Tax=Desulfothermobacter acidiphilus TaxID=1938353 RepID=UPI003F89D7FC
MAEEQTLYRAYRPQQFVQVVGQAHVTRTLSNALAASRIAHAYLFAGPRGTGKTSTARILAKALNCRQGITSTPCDACPQCLSIIEGTSMDVLEIDAASRRGIDEMRELRERVRLAPAYSRYKVYIIDEAHMLTSEAANALLKTLEEPPSQVVFVLATTEPHKMPATILSRCQRFDFRRLPVSLIQEHLGRVAANFPVQVEPEALHLLALAADGSMRDGLSLLDQALTWAGEELRAEEVAELLGKVPAQRLEEAVQALRRQDLLALFRLVAELEEEGRDLQVFTRDLLLRLRGETRRCLREKQRLPAWLGRSLMALYQALGEMRLSSLRGLTLELAFLRLLAAPEERPPSLERVRALWPDVLQLVKESSPRLFGQLCLARVVGVEGRRLQLAAGEERVRETLRKDESQALLGEALGRRFGGEWEIEVLGSG